MRQEEPAPLGGRRLSAPSPPAALAVGPNELLEPPPMPVRSPPPLPMAHQVVDGDAQAERGIQDADDASYDCVVVSPGRKRRSSGMFEFANSEAIKQKVRETKAIRPMPYNVKEHYHKEGVMQAIARDPWFENITLSIIIANAIWISVDTDWNGAETLLDADIGFTVADVLFFSYFSVELLIRFCAFERKLDCMKDAWFVFDSFLVALYAFDPFIMALIAAATGGGGVSGGSLPRLLRLLRLSRLVRMLRALPELMIMIKGMITAAATVSYTLGLLLVVTYVFAIALTNLGSEHEFGAEYLSSVGHSMYTLIIYCTFLDDLSAYADAVRAESTLCLIVSTIFIVFASMCQMNLLVGVLCEVISSAAEEERENIMVETVYERFSHIVQRLDANKDDMLSWDEFTKIMDMPEALRAFESVRVEPEGVIDFAVDLFQDESGLSKEISLHEFMDMVLELRGSQTVTIRDLMKMNKHINRKIGEVNLQLDLVEDKLESLGECLEGR